MKLIVPTFTLVTLSLLSSCSKKSSKEDPAPAKESAAIAVQAAPSAITIDAAPAQPDQGAIPHANWAPYFADFKTAALARDKVALAALVAIGEHIDQGTFDDFTTIYLTDEVLAVIKATEAEQVSSHDEEGEEVYELSWQDSTTVDGEEFESALFFYFKKIDGQFKLFRLLAAG